MNKQYLATNSFELEQNVYFKILLRTRLKDHWWFYLLLVIILFLNIGEFGQQSYATYIILLGLLYPVFSFFYLYFWSTSAKNKTVFIERHLVLEDDYITVFLKDGAENKLPYTEISHFVESRTFFLLHLANNQFIYVPKNCFKSFEDLNLFDSMIKSKLTS